MNLNIPTPDGLPQEHGQKDNLRIDQPAPKPEVIIKPELLAQMPGPMPPNQQALVQVDSWAK